MAKSGGIRRRSPAGGGYMRGGETRARIIEAAIRVFGDEGYERASTRRIAEEAGVKPPALQYYFDSKQGLHLACAEIILTYADAALTSALAAAKSALGRPGRQSATGALCDLLDALLDASLASVNMPGRARFMSRVQADGTGPAFPLIRDGIVRPIHSLCARLISASLGHKRLTDDARLRASVVLSQLMAFHIARSNTLALLGWKNFDGPRRDMVKRILRAHTRAAVTAS